MNPFPWPEQRAPGRSCSEPGLGLGCDESASGQPIRAEALTWSRGCCLRRARRKKHGLAHCLSRPSLSLASGSRSAPLFPVSVRRGSGKPPINIQRFRLEACPASRRPVQPRPDPRRPGFLLALSNAPSNIVLEPPYPWPNRAGQGRVRFQSPTDLFQLLSTNSLADCLVVPPTQRLTCE